MMINLNSSLNKENKRNIEFQTTNQEGEQSIEIYDLNKMFQVNFSYNFDLLKNLMEAIIKNQQNIQDKVKEKENKILDIEAQLIDLKICLADSHNPSQSLDTQKQPPPNPKLFSVIKGNNDILRQPPNDLKLEVSIGNDDLINQIIVSISYLFYSFFRKK